MFWHFWNLLEIETNEDLENMEKVNRTSLPNDLFLVFNRTETMKINSEIYLFSYYDVLY